jgi:PST family polysaccharide transporter
LLLLLGDEIVVLLYGAKWTAAGTILRILALLVFCRGISVLISPLLVSIRGNAPDAKIKLVEAATFLALLYPLTKTWGPVGAAWAGAIAFFITMVNRMYFVSGLLPNIANKILKTVLSGIVATGVGVAFGLIAILRIEAVTGRLLVGGSAIAIVVTGVMLLSLPELRSELAHLLSSVRGRDDDE